MAEHPHDERSDEPAAGPVTAPEVRTPATPASGSADTTTRRRSPTPHRAPRPTLSDRRKPLAAALAMTASLVTTIVVTVLAVHIVFAVFEANGSNDIVTAFEGWAEGLAWQFKDVFTPRDPKIAVLVNYGLAALVYLMAGRLVVRLIQRLG
jgi:hypothetical protein